jgi:hypothetical protein
MVFNSGSQAGLRMRKVKGLLRMQTVDELTIGELPPALLNDIMLNIAWHSIGFIRTKKTRNGKDYILLGSGTLVNVGMTHAILTAHHVLEVLKLLPRNDRLGILLSSTFREHTFDTQGLEYIEIAKGTNESEGPDLGAVILAPNIASSIQAKKVFYNLETRRDFLIKTPPHLSDGLWFINGFIDEKTTTIHRQNGFDLIKRFYNISCEGIPDPAVVVGNHDYFAFPVISADRSVTPKSFEGMSGGGLWQVLITRDEKGKLCHKPPLLSGVVFYQQCDSEGAFSVMCHGRLSVYQIVYNALNKTYH